MYLCSCVLLLINMILVGNAEKTNGPIGFNQGTFCSNNGKHFKLLPITTLICNIIL